MKELKGKLAAEQHPWAKQTLEEIFDRGLRELSSDEVQNKSVEWLRAVHMKSYLGKLNNKNSQAFLDLNVNLSPADHIHLICLLLPSHFQNPEALYLLA